ncbi:hypothetical protein A6R68_09660, partial [Neotoma lepida]
MSILTSMVNSWKGRSPRPVPGPQLWQTMQTQAHFQLLLPPGKMCSADYSGLLQAFQVFILDELTTRGFCQIRVKTFGTLVSSTVCDNSSIRLQCEDNDDWLQATEDVIPLNPYLAISQPTLLLMEMRPATGVTDCQRNEAGLQCDQDGQYQAIQRDMDSGAAFCVDSEGQRLQWLQSETGLSDSQCLMMQKFEKAPESKVIFDANSPVIVKSKVPGADSPLVQCLADCADDEACSYLTVSTVGPEVSCDFYSWTRDNFACMTSDQEQDAVGNSEATSFRSLKCQVKVRTRGADSLAVYVKKGHESTAAGQKSFEPTGFQTVLSGLYSPVVFSASGANLTDAHVFCLLACDRDSCCDGFILTQVKADVATELFLPVDTTQVIVNASHSLPSKQHWLFTHLFSAEQAKLWCLSPVQSGTPSFCPSAALPSLTEEKVALNSWQTLPLSSVIVDPSIKHFDVAHISAASTSNFSVAQDFCLQ